MSHAAGAAALFALGNKHMAQGDPDAAVAAYRHCVELTPGHPGAWYNLGNALAHAGRTVEAVESYVACLRAEPGFGTAYVNLSEALRRLTLLAQAREMAELAIRYLPDEPAAVMCLANVLYDQAHYDDAASLYRLVHAVRPGHAGALTNLGNTLCAMGDLTGALSAHYTAVNAAAEDPNVRYNRAVTRLAAGDFEPGWTEYEFRWQRTQARPRPFGPAWQGEPIEGQTILLHAEQGLGDTIHFARYTRPAAKQAGSVVLEVQPLLARLLARSMPFARVVARGGDVPRFDTHCPLLSLPRAFGTTLNTIPADTPYLHADPGDVAAWAARLPVTSGLRVGICWASAQHLTDAGAHLISRRRSLGIADIADLVGIDGVTWIGLQKEPPEPPPNGLLAWDPMPDVSDFADTAAIIANLDLVVSVDTSVAHLAGALGCPVWLMNRYDTEWRWLHERADSPWYPTMRIYRQARPLDWSDVVSRIRADLAVTAASAGGS